MAVVLLHYCAAASSCARPPPPPPSSFSLLSSSSASSSVSCRAAAAASSSGSPCFAGKKNNCRRRRRIARALVCQGLSLRRRPGGGGGALQQALGFSRFLVAAASPATAGFGMAATATTAAAAAARAAGTGEEEEEGAVAAAAAAAAGLGDGGGEGLREVFEKLKGKLKEISALEGVQNLLTWDQQVYMPLNGVAARGEQQAVIARVLHAQQTDEKTLGAYLHRLMMAGQGFEKLKELGFSQLEIASVREAARDYSRMRRKPVELAARAARLEATGVSTWQRARKEKDFGLFAPVLQEWIDIITEEAAAVVGEADSHVGEEADSSHHVYDFCLDKFERGASTRRLDPFFASIKTPLVGLVRQIHKTREGANRQFLQSKDLFSGTFSLETQKRLAKRFSEELGFEFDSGRFDESMHPMTINIVSPFDVRITSRFSETDLSSGILATLHETGHGLYEQGRNAQACKEGLPVSRPPGMGMHESQSLLWEKQVGMSAEYWEHYWPIVLRNFSSLPHSEYTEFHRVINEIKPSFIRVSADEVSYPLHILLRYEIEKGLLQGSIRVADVPAVWNQKMEEYLGIVPRDDAEGCLQDIHWGIGLFGYFPTYTLGAVYAAMIFQAAEKEIPELRKCIKQGKFKPLREWLRKKIHAVGSLYETADELVEKVTGSKLDASCFLNYLSSKYGALYNLSSAEVKAVAIRS